MSRRSKYHALFEHFRQSEKDEVMLTFAQIERLIGAALPASARRKRAFWSNRGSRGAQQAAPWIKAGYETSAIDLEGERVTFRNIARAYPVKRKRGAVQWNGALVKALRRYLNLNQSQLAEELGVRQQTVSEWETGMYAPSRAMSKYLSLVAERAGFTYGEEG
jgi:DNA-binding transcriptional regulator YiaG